MKMRSMETPCIPSYLRWILNTPQGKAMAWPTKTNLTLSTCSKIDWAQIVIIRYHRRLNMFPSKLPIILSSQRFLRSPSVSWSANAKLKCKWWIPKTISNLECRLWKPLTPPTLTSMVRRLRLPPSTQLRRWTNPRPDKRRPPSLL